MIEGHPVALQLRYLQTLLELGSSQATTIVFPAPIDLIRPFLERSDRASNGTDGGQPPLPAQPSASAQPS